MVDVGGRIAGFGVATGKGSMLLSTTLTHVPSGSRKTVTITQTCRGGLVGRSKGIRGDMGPREREYGQNAFCTGIEMS